MTVTVKFFASLKELQGTTDSDIPASGVAKVRDVWLRATDRQSPPDNLLCAVNHQHAELDSPVNDGDEVAFFPPVTGG